MMTALALAFALAVQLAEGGPTAPAARFTMTPTPGDTIIAELFPLTSGDRGAQVERLLDGTKVTHDALGPMIMAYRQGEGPGNGMVLYAATGSGGPQDAACRLRWNGDGTVDNRDRALRWCLSFLDRSATPTIVLPASD